jgi:hypothetical protein
MPLPTATQEPAMTTRPTTDYPATETRTRATAFGLAALVTLSLLAGMDGVADRQYEAAFVAQISTGSVQVAAHPALSPKAA